MQDEKLLNVEIVTPEKVLFSGKAVSVSVPGSKSPFQVLYNHAPIVTSLDLGIIKIIDESNHKLFFASSPGFTEVRQNKVSILVENAQDASLLKESELSQIVVAAREKLSRADIQETALIKEEISIAENMIKAARKAHT
jgi:F-type H+-transporting ATPase subunit epsilon